MVPPSGSHPATLLWPLNVESDVTSAVVEWQGNEAQGGEHDALCTGGPQCETCAKQDPRAAQSLAQK